jgi:hypothetical protein
MRLKDIPTSPAYLVFHDGFDNGAMEVWPVLSLGEAQTKAKLNQDKLEQSGNDDGGSWRAYEKLPRVRVWKFHSEGGR